MQWNPYVNAVGAAGYIGAIALIMNLIQSVRHDTPDSIFDAMGFLSLFVFSAAVMGFLFFYRPAVLLMENKREEAISYFLKTLGTFGAITLLVIVSVSLQ